MLNILVGNIYGVIFTLLGCMLLINYATGELEDQLSIIGNKFKMTGSVRGATLDAISSSLPEFLTAIISLILLKEKGLEVGIGTISGSAIFNILIIPFCSILLYKRVSRKGFKIINGVNRDVIFYMLSIIILLAGLYVGNLFIMSILLISLYCFYIIYLYMESKSEDDDTDDTITWLPNIKFIKIIFMLFLTYIGVELSIRCAEFIGRMFGISTIVISLVLLAAITSIPDTLLSVKSSRKGNIDASLSNAVGSNIFDVCIGLGVPILIGTSFMGLNPVIEFNSIIPIFAFLIFSVIVYVVTTYSINSKGVIKKIYGFNLLIMYLTFILYILFIN